MSTSLIKTLQENSPTLEALMAINTPGIDTHAKVIQEISFVQERVMRNPALEKCTAESMLIAVKKAINYNLTLDPEAGLMYMLPSNIKDSNGQWVSVVDAPRTANGDLSVAYQCGVILDHERPKIEYNDAKQVVKVTVRLLRPSYPNPRWEEMEFTNDTFKRLMSYSHKKNGRNKNDADPNKLNYANALYTSHHGWIDPEFAATKAIRQALKKLGTNPNAKMNSIPAPIPVEKRVDTKHEEAEIIEEHTHDITPDQL